MGDRTAVARQCRKCVDMSGGPTTPRKAARWGIALATIGLISGCGGPASAAAVHVTSLPTTTCAGSVPTGDVALTLNSGGVNRSVVVHIPRGYTDRTPVALILNLHGSGSTPAAQEAFSGMDRVSDAEGFIVAYPQGAITSGSGYDWHVPGQPLFGGGTAPANAPDDVTFLAQVIQRLEVGLCVDPRRVFATGFSGGARMTSQLGCDLSTTIAAIAPVSGLRLPSPCTGTRAVPVISFHGTADPIDPYDGNGQAYWTYSVPVAAQRWAAHDGCSRDAPGDQPGRNRQADRVHRLPRGRRGGAVHNRGRGSRMARRTVVASRGYQCPRAAVSSHRRQQHHVAVLRSPPAADGLSRPLSTGGMKHR